MPCACQSRLRASSVVTVIAATGPAFAMKSAGFAARPQPISSGFRPLRTQNRNPVAAAPTISVGQWVFCTCRASAYSSASRL